MKYLMCALVGFSLMLGLCLHVRAQEETKKEEPKAEETKKAEDDGMPAAPERPKSLEDAVKMTEVVFVGVVDYVGEKPAGWGKFPFRPTTQFLRYEVIKILKGKLPAKQIGVIHELLQGSKTCASQPGLNPEIFDIDRKVIILANFLPEGADTGQKINYIAIDPDYGGIRWSEDEEKRISAMIGK